jgi:rod shape-determining protein MreC
VLSRIGHGSLSEFRGGFVDLTAPVFEVTSKPVIFARHEASRFKSYIGLFGEIDRLKAENEQLKHWEWRAKLAERDVGQLRSLLNAVDEAALHFVSGSVIADARGPFLRSALINLGRDDGMRVGYAVIDGNGLIGRIVEAGGSASRVLLLSDLNSQVPVLVGRGGVRAMASGDNGAELRLEFLPEAAVVHPGDEVFTSGSDGVLPRGLRVGLVRGSAGAYKVRPHADFGALDVVSVLFFDAPALTRTDPPAISAVDRALSASPGDAELPTGALAAPSAIETEIKQAGASGATAAEGVAQSPQ